MFVLQPSETQRRYILIRELEREMGSAEKKEPTVFLEEILR